MHPLIADLIANGPVLTDGAWGTQLQARGLGLGEFPDVWNLSHPDQVKAVARSYVEAGSRVILTNTFGANRIRLADHATSALELIREINQHGVMLSKWAAQNQALVFASIGPTGKLLLSGDVTPEEVYAAFLEQAQALADAGADALVVESMGDIAEAKLAVAAAKSTHRPVVGCMVYDSGAHRDRTMMGTTPESDAAALADAGADVIGINCGRGIADFPALCRRMRAVTDLPLWMKANAGLPELVDGKAFYRTTPTDFAAFMPALVDAGAQFVGGCCGSSPDFIRETFETLRSLPRTQSRTGHQTRSS